MVGSTMIYLLVLGTGADLFSTQEQVGAFFFVSYPDYPITGAVCEKVR